MHCPRQVDLNKHYFQQARATLSQDFAQDNRLVHQAALAVALLLAALILLWILLYRVTGGQIELNLALLVHLFAEGVMLFTLLRIGISLPVVARIFSELTFLELLAEMVARVQKARHRLVAYCRLATNPLRLARQQVLVAWRQIERHQHQRPPGVWSKSQAPLLLFQQAALLLVP